MEKYSKFVEQNLFSCEEPGFQYFLRRAIDIVVTHFQNRMKNYLDSGTPATCKANKCKINQELTQKCKHKRPVYIVIPTDEKQFQKVTKKDAINPDHCRCCCYHVQYHESQCPTQSCDPSPVIKTEKPEEEQKTQLKCNTRVKESQGHMCRLCGGLRHQQVKACDKNEIPFSNKVKESRTNVQTIETKQEYIYPPPYCWCQDCHMEELPREESKNGQNLFVVKEVSPTPSADDVFGDLKLTGDDFPATDAIERESIERDECDNDLQEHYLPVLEALQENAKSTTDVVVLVGPEEFHAHKVMLSAYSDYFHYHLLKRDRHCFDITDEGVTVRGVHLALKWMYTGHVEMTQENIGHLWAVAKRLGIRRLCKLCKQQLRKMIRQHGREMVEKLIEDEVDDDDDCAVVVLEEEKKYHQEKHPDPTPVPVCVPKMRASNNVGTLLKDGDFVHWSLRQILRFMTHSNLHVKSEKQVFDMAAAWLRHGWPARENYVTQIMNCVRFPLMTRQEIIESFTRRCNKFLWTNKEVVTNVLVSYLESSEKLNSGANGYKKPKRQRDSYYVKN